MKMDYSKFDNNMNNWESHVSTCSSVTCQYLCEKKNHSYESLEITFDYELLVPVSEQLANVLPSVERNLLEGLAQHFNVDSCALELDATTGDVTEAIENKNLITGLSYLPQDAISTANGGACSKISTDEIFEERGFTCIPVQGFVTMYYVADSHTEVSSMLLDVIEQEANYGNLIKGTQIKRLAYVGNINSGPNGDQPSTIGLRNSSGSKMMIGMSAVAVAIVGIFISAGLFIRKKGVRNIRRTHELNSTPSVTIGKRGGLRLQDQELKRSDLDDITKCMFSTGPYQMSDDDLEIKKAQLKKHGLTKTNLADLFLRQGSLSTISEGQENETRSSSTGLSGSHMMPYPRIMSDSMYSDDVQLSTCSHLESAIFDEDMRIDPMEQNDRIIDV